MSYRVFVAFVAMSCVAWLLSAMPTNPSRFRSPGVVHAQDELPELIVDSALDSGTGTLRAALQNIEEQGGRKHIKFQLSETDPNFDPKTGTWTIKLKAPLVVARDEVIIDGLSQRDFGGDTNPNGPEVVIDAANLVPKIVEVLKEDIYVDSVFLVYGVDKTVIRGLTILPATLGDVLGLITCTLKNGSVDPVTGTVVSDNYIGLLPDGETSATGNWYGITMRTGVQDAVIENNVFSTPGPDITIIGNGLRPELPNSLRNAIRGNKLGTNAAGTKRIAPTALQLDSDAIPYPSISIRERASNTTVENNIIAGTRTGGVGPLNRFTEECSNFTTIRNNRIGVGINGENVAPNPKLDKGQYSCGIYAVGDDSVSGNTIGNFGLCGIHLRNQFGQPEINQTRVQDNRFSNLPVGIQIGQIDRVLIQRNTFTDCQAGVSLSEKLVSPLDIFAVIFNTNPFKYSTQNVTITQNTYIDIDGPGIGFMESPIILLTNIYVPNTFPGPVPGPNSYWPSPVFQSAELQADKSILVKGTVVGNGRVELYSSNRSPKPGAPPTETQAYGVGTFIQGVDVKNGLFITTIPASRAAGVGWLTATQTVEAKTSEFARTIAVAGAPPPLDTSKPRVTVSSPADGLVVESREGARVAVRWTSRDNTSVTRHSIRFTGRRNDVPFTQTVVTGLSGAARGFDMNLTRDDVVTEAQIVVEAADAAGNLGQGVSGTFSVVLPKPGETEKPTVKILNPTAGAVIESKTDAQVVVAWESKDNIGVVSHEVLLDRDGNPETLASGLAGTTQNFIWKLQAGTTIAEAVVTVEAKDEAGNIGRGASGTFSVKPPAPADTAQPTVTEVTTSKKKVVRKKDASVTVSWKSTDNVGVVGHEVSFAEDGRNFTVKVASGLAGSVREFTWTVPSAVGKTTTGTFLVVARDAAGNSGVGIGGGPLTVK